MDLSDATHRVVVRGATSADQRFAKFAAAVASADNMQLFAGHSGARAITPGAPLPEADTWSIYIRADTADDARDMVSDVIKDLEQPMFIAVEVEAVDLST